MLGSVEVLFLWLFLRTIFRNSNRFCREYPAYCQKIDAEVRKIGPKIAIKTKPQQNLRIPRSCTKTNVPIISHNRLKFLFILNRIHALFFLNLDAIIII